MRGRLSIFGVLVLLLSCGEPSASMPAAIPDDTQPEPLLPETKPLILPSYYLSDLLWESSSNALGPVERNAANGFKEGGDGATLTVSGETYENGFGTAAPSEIVFNLGETCSSFAAEVGVDDAADGSVSFEVYADDAKIWESGLMTSLDPAKMTGVLDIAGTQRLKLVTNDAEDSEQHDYGDWLIPTVACAFAPPALAPNDAHSKGVFGLAQSWPTIPTHAALLPDSTLITWYSRDTDGTTRIRDYNDQDLHNFTVVDLWDVNTNSHSRVDNTTTDLFCSGFTLNSEGNLYVAGGNLGSSDTGFYPGSKFTNIFDVTQRTWEKGPDMSEGRWYPSVISLPNKELLMMGGDSNETTLHNFIPDVWNPSTNTLRRLLGASSEDRDMHSFYPWLHVAPNGQVFYSGSSHDMAYLDTTGQGEWSEVYERDSLHRGYGSSVMFEPGKILVMGGGGNTKSAVTIDLSSGVDVAATASMKRGRTNLNATLLADGTVFVNGGNTSGTNFDDTTSVYSSELWNPATGEWQLGAVAQKPRNYHAVSILLPDGRVLTGGGGGCGACGVNHQDIEMYYPPYLFKKDGSGLLAERPQITEAPSTMSYHKSYVLTTSKPKSIEKVALVALGSVTHSFNMNQRYVPLTIESKTDSVLSVTSPSNANLAPPGYYLLFVIDSGGVPSVARIVQMQ